MKLTIATIITAATLATVSFAGEKDNEYCMALSGLSKQGVIWGEQRYPLGSSEDIIKRSTIGSEEKKRAYLAIFLNGYAAGLLGEEPDVVAAKTLLTCLKEIRS